MKYLAVLFFFLSVTAYSQNTTSQRLTYPGIIDLSGSGEVWKLDNTEWLKYKELMTGEAGLFYANRTPYYVLAAYEDDPVKRRAYAKRVLEAKERFHKQTIAIFELQNLIVAQDYGVTRKPKEAALPAVNRSKRSTVFVTLDCPPCDSYVIRESKKRASSFDVYIVGSGDDDNVVRRWANKVGLPPEKIKSKQITINHGSSLASSLRIKNFPAFFDFDGLAYTKERGR